MRSKKVKKLKFILIIIISIYTLFGCSSNVEVPHYSCDFLPQKPAPTWIDNRRSLSRINSGKFYYGIGVSGRVSGGPTAQIKASRISALKNLSENISTMINSYMTSEEKYSSLSNQTLYNIHSVINQTTMMVLSGSSVVSLWLDRNSCLLWTYVVIPKKIVDKLLQERFEAIKKLDRVEQYINEANNQDLSFMLRIFFCNKGIQTLNSIDFSLIDSKQPFEEGSLYKRFWLKLKNLKEKILYEKERTKENSIYQKAESFYNMASNPKYSKDNRLHYINLAISIIENSNLSELGISKDSVLSKYKRLKKFINNRVLRLINIGMSKKQVESLLGKPQDIVSSLLWYTTSGYRYGDDWILFEHGHVQCIVDEKGITFKGVLGTYVRTCQWHLEHVPQYVLKYK